MEVLSALIQAQQRLGRDFTKEEFKSGTVGTLLIAEDFKPAAPVSKTISLYSHFPVLLIGRIGNKIHNQFTELSCRLALLQKHVFLLETTFPDLDRGYPIMTQLVRTNVTDFNFNIICL